MPILLDPVATPLNRERRRWIRHKLHTPVYASFNGPHTGLVVDLSELLDLHENGFSVQTGEKLEMNRAVTLCLELPETRNYIHGSGQVMWSDDTGRGGIRFSELSGNSRQILKEWLFANLLVACSNHAARTEQRAVRKIDNDEKQLLEPAPASEAPAVVPRAKVPISDGEGMLSSVEAVRDQIREIGNDIDAVLQLITDCAVNLTGASGAALAFLTEERMVCRARVGYSAPPLGAPVDAKSGLSGECIRSGLLISCADTEIDPRIDPDLCRALGIASLMAAPIASDFQVLGLLEVFSPHPHAFTTAHATVLERLVGMIPKTHHDKPGHEHTGPEKTPPDSIAEATHQPFTESPTQLGKQMSQLASDELSSTSPSEPPSEHPSESPVGAPSRLLYRALLGLASVAVAMTVGYLLGPVIEKRWAPSPQASQRAFDQRTQSASTVSGQQLTDQSSIELQLTDRSLNNRSLANSAGHTSPDQMQRVKSLAELQKFADQGDAEAQWQMGVRYHTGDGVPHDDNKAVGWFLRAAERGHVIAQSTLGAYYWAGRGVPQDLSKAYFWSALALADGDMNSKSRLEGLASQMTRAQVSAAREQAEDWIHNHNQRAKSE